MKPVNHALSYALDLLREIVEIPTVNPPGENYEKISRVLEKRLRDAGLDVDVVEIPEDFVEMHYPYRPQHRGYPRFIVLGRAGNGKPVLHFNGHYDVVPPGSGWSFDPFKLAMVGDKIYGRGTTDMKGGIAASVAAIKSLLDEGWSPRGSVEFAFVPDEEAGGVGSRYLAEKKLAAPDYVVIAEPTTSRGIVIGHKGLVRGVVKVYGKQVHGSAPWSGDNAFVKACKLVTEFLKAYQPVLESRRTAAPVKYPQGVYPTINLGGYAESTSRKDNIVPGEFIFSFDRRVIPEEDLNHVIRELEDYLKRAAESVGAKIEVNVLSTVPPSYTPINAELVKTTSECIERELTAKAEIYLSLGRNDAVYYTNILGVVQTINYGPGVEFVAHAPDEYTTVDELMNAIKVYRCIAKRLLGE